MANIKLSLYCIPFHINMGAIINAATNLKKICMFGGNTNKLIKLFKEDYY